MPIIKSASPAATALIKKYEALRLSAYLCPAGKLTIGWGHVLMPLDYALFNVAMARMAEIVKINQAAGPNGHIKIPLHINADQAHTLLERDVAMTARFLASVTQVDLRQWQFDALVVFVFNVGQGNYAKSTLRKQVDAGDWAAATAEFGRWVYATANGKKEKLQGLVARRADEAALFAKA